jgi:hypothetical protein
MLVIIVVVLVMILGFIASGACLCHGYISGKSVLHNSSSSKLPFNEKPNTVMVCLAAASKDEAEQRCKEAGSACIGFSTIGNNKNSWRVCIQRPVRGRNATMFTPKTPPCPVSLPCPVAPPCPVTPPCPVAPPCPKPSPCPVALPCPIAPPCPKPSPCPVALPCPVAPPCPKPSPCPKCPEGPHTDHTKTCELCQRSVAHLLNGLTTHHWVPDILAANILIGVGAEHHASPNSDAYSRSSGDNKVLLHNNIVRTTTWQSDVFMVFSSKPLDTVRIGGYPITWGKQAWLPANFYKTKTPTNPNGIWYTLNAPFLFNLQWDSFAVKNTDGEIIFEYYVINFDAKVFKDYFKTFWPKNVRTALKESNIFTVIRDPKQDPSNQWQVAVRDYKDPTELFSLMSIKDYVNKSVCHSACSGS